ncbi:MAG: hypothetical protein Q8K20_13405 [Gemmobacter sp.]|nr:hypothetical protein [Gemmobacter sp.]
MIGRLALLALVAFPAPAAADWTGLYRAPEGFAPRRDDAARWPRREELRLGRAIPAPAATQPAGPDPLPAVSGVPALTAPAAAGGPPRAPERPEASDLPRPASGSLTGIEETLCLREIRAAETRHAIPAGLLLAIGLQEAGMTSGETLTVWPWTVHAAGRGHFFATASEAEAFAQKALAADPLVDVGCMQVNLRWHPDAFVSLAQAFDPAANVDYAARYLAGLAGPEADWRGAVGRYHSGQPEAQARYLAGVMANLAVIAERRDAFDALAGLLDEDALPAPAQPAPPVLWSREADVGTAPVWSIYSRQALEPVLPVFSKSF